MSIYGLYETYFNRKYTNRLKELKTVYHGSTKHKANMALLISAKIECKIKSITKEWKQIFHDKISIYQEDTKNSNYVWI